MGDSDRIIIPEQIAFLDCLAKENLITNELPKIIHLGVPHEGPLTRYYDSVFPNATMELRDIAIKNWDINSPWELEGYDMVVCHRTTPYVINPKSFLKELKICIANNSNIIFDFTLYEGSLEGSSSKRCPPSRSAKFDFRSMGEMPGEMPDRYLDFKMTGSVVGEDFRDEGIYPDYFNTKWNPIKGDLTTYMFWQGGGSVV